MTAELVERPANPIATHDTDSWTDVLVQVGHLADLIADTEFVPRALRGSPPAVAAAMLYGREVGLPPMTSLTQVHVVEGRPGLAAEAMRAMILADGHDFEIRATTGAICTIAGRRRGTTRWYEITWTLDMARAAELIKPRGNWAKYPRAMLKARATAELARDLFPDVIHGFAALEEITDDALIVEGADEAPTPATSNTVQRKARKAPTRKAIGAPVRPATPDPAPSPIPTSDSRTGPPPLPGDDGFSGWDPTSTVEGQASSPPVPSTVEPDPVDAPVDEAPAPSVEDPPENPPSGPPTSAEDPVDGDLVDAEIVDEETGEIVDAGEIVVVDNPDPEPARRRDVVRLALDFDKLGITDRDRRLAYCSVLIGRDVDSSNELTRAEAHGLIETLGRCDTIEDLDNVVAATEIHRTSNGSE